MDWDKNILVDPQEIFGSDKDITRAEVHADLVVVYANNSVPGQLGGEISIRVKEVGIYNEQDNPISFDELVKLSDSYWSNFGK